uniref:Uncharacterized protein n=1 Tax=Cajanus cajan TaxID=3821 RepID=A0A151T6M5_CAJCA|nr:hypothetical protein KK1_017240 [Cajanus cajan]
MSRHRKRSAMEGVGARLGRSSTRYGPATVFTGPVRKWKKKWVHVSPSSASSNSNTNHNHNHNHTHNHTHTHSHASNASHLLLYKWTPITQSHNTTTNSNANGTAKDALPEPPEEPPRRKFKYVPVFMLLPSSLSLSFSNYFSLGFYWTVTTYNAPRTLSNSLDLKNVQGKFACMVPFFAFDKMDCFSYCNIFIDPVLFGFTVLVLFPTCPLFYALLGLVSSY